MEITDLWVPLENRVYEEQQEEQGDQDLRDCTAMKGIRGSPVKTDLRVFPAAQELQGQLA